LDDRARGSECLATARRTLDYQVTGIQSLDRSRCCGEQIARGAEDLGSVAKAWSVPFQNARHRPVVAFPTFDHGLCIASDRLTLDAVITWSFWNERDLVSE